MKARFIINPASGKQNFLKEIESYVGCLVLNRVVDQFDIVYTKQEGDAYASALSVKPGEFDFIVSVGGDGTLNDVVNGLVEGGTETPLAVISVGTANHFAQYVYLEERAEDFCRMIMEFKLRAIDVGKINDHYFINRVTGGMGANVGDRVSQESKAVLGKMAYFMEGARDFASKGGVALHPVRFLSKQYKGDDEVLNFSVVNSGLTTEKSQEMNSKKGSYLDVTIMKKIELNQMPALGLATLTNRMGNHPKIQQFKTRKMRIETMHEDGKPLQIDYDGRALNASRADISLIPQALKLIVP